MKKKLTLMCLAFLAIASVAVNSTKRADAAEPKVTIDFSGSEDVWGIGTTKIVEKKTFTYGGYSIQLEGTEGNGYRWYDTGNILLGKQGATLTLPAFDFAVSKIEVVGTSGASAAVKQNIFVGETAVSTETTGAKDVTNVYEISEDYQAAGNVYVLKVTSNHNTQITAIKIYEKGSVTPDAVAKPTITGETPFAEQTTVTLACATDGAEIFYTTDGSDPTAQSTKYTEPFVLTVTATVKAIAIKGDSQSEIASKDFVCTSIANLAALNVLTNSSEFTFTGEVLVVAKPTAKYVYVKDATGSSLIFDNSGEKTAAAEVGKTIAANWTGKVSIYKNLFEAVPDNALVMKDGDPVKVSYEAADLADVKEENVNKVVALKGVNYTLDGKNVSITKGNGVAVGYNQFGLEIAAPEEGKTYNIVGAIGRYNDKIQFWPITIEEAVPAEDITISPESGADIAAVLTAAAEGKNVGNITINLAEGGVYTTSASIAAPGNVTINGNGATIDASALTTPFIQMATIAEDAELNEKGAYVIDGIVIKDVTITGLPYQLIFANKQKYLMNQVLVENCVIGINGAAKKTIFDFNGGGNTADLTINKSTLWANPSNEQNGGLHSSQSGQGSIQDLGSDKQLFAITNSTIYNIAYGKTTNSQRRNNTKGMEFKVENSVIVNSGKSGQFVAGLNGGAANAAQTYTISNNIFNFDGEDTSAAEEAKAQEKIEGITFNSIAGVMTFKSTETPDFGGVFALGEGAAAPATPVGDPRWTITYESTGIQTVSADKFAEGEWFTIQGVRVEKPTKGLFIHNGRKVVVK